MLLIHLSLLIVRAAVPAPSWVLSASHSPECIFFFFQSLSWLLMLLILCLCYSFIPVVMNHDICE